VKGQKHRLFSLCYDILKHPLNWCLIKLIMSSSAADDDNDSESKMEWDKIDD